MNRLRIGDMDAEGTPMRSVCSASTQAPNGSMASVRNTSIGRQSLLCPSASTQIHEHFTIFSHVFTF